MRTPYASALAVTAACALLYLLRSPAPAAPDASRPDDVAALPGTPSFALEDDAWLTRSSAAPTRLEYRSTRCEADAPCRSVSLDTFGPLDDDEVAVLRRRIEAQLRGMYARLDGVAARPGSGPDGEKTVHDALQELDALLMAKRQEAKLQILDEGQYVTVAAGRGHEVRWPSGYLISYSRTKFLREGKPLDVVFGVAPDHSLVAPYYEEVRLFQRLSQESSVEEFNRLDFCERQRRIQASRAAAARLAAIDVQAEPAQRRALLDEIVGDMLPGEWIVDEAACFVRLRE